MSMEVSLVYIIGIMMFAVALYDAFSIKPISIYNQGKPPHASELTDVKKYNQATAKLMFIYGCRNFNNHAWNSYCYCNI